MDACGWAINARARINVPFGARLTSVARLPAGSRSSVDERFAQRAPMWPQILDAVIAVCFVYSLLNDFGLIERLMAWGGLDIGAAQQSGASIEPGSAVIEESSAATEPGAP
jgi:hypothetical protein